MYRIKNTKHQIPSLMECVVYNLEVGISLQLKYGSNPNVYNAYGQSPLHLAIESGRKFVALNLIKYGAKINVRDSYDQNAFDLALDKLPCVIPSMLCESVYLTKGEQKEFLKYFYDGIYPNTIIFAAQFEVEFLPVLLNTLVRENPQIVFSLLNTKTQFGSALILIVKNEELEIDKHLLLIERLLALGCDINLQDKKGKTALFWAFENNNIDTINQLLEYNASLLIRNKFGLNVLDFAHAQLPHLIEYVTPFAMKLSAESQKNLLANISNGIYEDYITFLSAEFPYFLYLALPTQDRKLELTFLNSINFDRNLQMIKNEVVVLLNKNNFSEIGLHLSDFIRGLARLRIGFLIKENALDERKIDFMKNCKTHIEYIQSKTKNNDNFASFEQKLINFKNAIKLNETRLVEEKQPELAFSSIKPG